MKRRWLAFVAVALLTVPAAALAQGHAQHDPQQGQQEQPRPGMMPMGQGPGMMGGMGTMEMMMGLPGPGLILRQKEALNLSDSQVQELEALQKQASDAHQAHMREMEPIHRDVTQALEADKPDLARYESGLKRLADHHVKVHVEMARLGQLALDVLTPEQRSNVRYGMRVMRGMMGGGMMRMGGAMVGMMGGGCPIMEPGEMKNP